MKSARRFCCCDSNAYEIWYRDGLISDEYMQNE